MIQTLNLVKLIYPFILLVAFFCLYRKQYRFMKVFYWKMTLLHEARRFYTRILTLVLMLVMWCCMETDFNLTVVASALLSLCFLYYPVADRVLHRLHESKRLWAATLVVSLVSYSIPHMNSMFLLLFTASMASIFYPSEKVLSRKSLPGFACNKRNLLSMILNCYY